MTEELKVVISAEMAKFASAMKEAIEALNKMNEALKDAEDTSKKSEKQVKSFAEKAKEAFNKAKKSVSDFNDDMQKVGDIAKKGLATAFGAVAGATTALLGLAKSTEEYRNSMAKLETAFESAGSSAEQAQETYNDLYRVLGDSDVAVEASAHLAQLTQNQQALSEWANICQGVYATFGDSLPIEGLTEAVNHTAKLGEVQGVLADALEWSGVNVDNFNLKLANCNTEAEREALIRNTLNGIYDEASALYEENNAQILAQNEAQAKLDANLARMGEALAPVITMLTELGANILAQLTPYIEEFADNYLPLIAEALSDVGTLIGECITWIAEHWDLISTLGTMFLIIASALTAVSVATSIVNGAFTLLSMNPWVLGITAFIVLMAYLITHWEELGATVKKWGEAIANFVKSMVDKVVSFFSNMKEKVSNKITEMKESAVNKFNEIKEGIQNKIQEAKDKVVNTITTLKTNIASKITEIKNNVAQKFNEVKQKITEPVEKAREAVGKVVEKIKNLFNFQWSLPKLKVPRFTITPAGWSVGDLLKGSIPRLGVSWNARGGVFTKPTIMSYGNSLQGLGEAGAEAIVPLENNTEWLTKIADMLDERQDKRPVYLMVDKKVLGQASADGMNEITRMTGKVPINVL